MKTTFFITTFFFAILFSACNDSTFDQAPSIDLKSITLDSICIDSVFTTTIDDLTDADITGLLLMREEEKMSHDIYTYFLEQYSEQIFERIAFSESRHADAILRLLNHFGIEDPTIDEVGVFNNQNIQNLYNESIAFGAESIEAALSVGAFIEETDINDLQGLINATENSDLIIVYSKLLRGSGSHLKAFVRYLLSYNISYTPEVLSQEVYDTILATPNGNGNGYMNQGGNGNHGGNGNQGGNGTCNGSGQSGKNGNNGSNGGGGNGHRGNG